ncbi:MULTISPECIES: P-loop NTPase fold protein [unclassified Neisseria]|uniref:KAP family P-loop NTPase fold protein n=1 Tax=unclassified Neisseria TaxID=2623750 RepID=UPI002666A5C1|nr:MULTISPECIES: P-loop NTPase fold protein [unclassified Neisseria]MDO1509992.1 P-loop NTPase fold protein [Neisseria sp. MVDL19-042950]MDO1516192.1 P-loop NTPase fold protein [Neisseria sp. MVDL18-041461]MDO1563307.1 P-loop NTPase fold protein [Neisseria sp. MVDL20-010259]
MEPKTFESRDEFNRKPIAQNIISLLSSDIDISPMVIDSGWGTGKTEFCQKLIALMKQEHPDYQLVYVDAFRSDHSGEPLLALLAQIIKDCTPEDQANGEPSPKRKEWTKKFAKAAGFVAKTVAKAAAGHLLKQSVENLADGWQQDVGNETDSDQVAEIISNTMVKVSDKAIDSTVEILLKEQIEAERNLETLRQCLSEFANEKPIILFVDELDRCRPDYAVEMLETIKHVFDVPNVQVVLVTNTHQLRAAINHRYGLAVDSQRYLDKFLKYSFTLPEKSLDQHDEKNQVLASVKHFTQLVQASSVLQDTGLNNHLDELVMFFATSLVARNELSLREVETFVRYLEIYHRLSRGFASDAITGYQFLRITGVFLFCFKPDIKESLIRDKADGRQIAEQVLGFVPSPLTDWSNTSAIDIIATGLVLNKQDPDSWREKGNHQWEAYMSHIFHGTWKIPKNMFSPIKEAIRYLQLGK